MSEAFQFSAFPLQNSLLASQSLSSRLLKPRTNKSRRANVLQLVASVSMSRRSIIRLALLTGVFWRFSVLKNPALADGAISFATKITSRRRYGPRILSLEQDINSLDSYIHNHEWNKVEELVSERYLNAQNKPRTGKFWLERNAFQLFGSGVFRDNKDILQRLENEEQQFFTAATRLSRAASKNDLEESERAYTDLKNAYYEFLHEAQLKTEDSVDV
ncbi:hypothetical protein Gasu2_37700 [Galdieria sulphuraria]|uniref:Uncharacterized protein n=1 Tax=Galdieria sulphuraria TaxID=130081 RepID=M2XBW2_GALSU|nr:uncharacterized protein Gasu_50960 [Galdieria sulphuraria]EME27367.1 hypothetical protein Gasu_50960 [Galdieria sulphuraria]GJD09523.1 hypothetical protein Gasu2_37700 [Galdieria sulphuraria]|eukprot:XP_005703887.1 hypothetical protein Gasu_50960 [Galdieria sulphuraria]